MTSIIFWVLLIAADNGNPTIAGQFSHKAGCLHGGQTLEDSKPTKEFKLKWTCSQVIVPVIKVGK